MTHRYVAVVATLLCIASSSPFVAPARADGDLNKVEHLVFMMQENRSFDNYFGALPYVPGGAYHPCSNLGKLTDHRCVDGLACQVDAATGEPICNNFNLNLAGERIFAFHDRRICLRSGLDHGWPESHREANWDHPESTATSSPNDGFVRQNESDNPHQDVDYDTIGFYTQEELPFYYAVAQSFAISDRYHASVIGPTLPNRLYFMAGTSFGHTTTGEAIPPIPAGYRPLGGTLLDEMDANHVSWMNYYVDLPSSAYLRPFLSEHLAPISQFATDLAAGKLADVTYIDAHFGILSGAESDESPPNSVRRGEYYVAQNIAAIRNSPFWKNTIIIVTYDEHGGCYDHVPPPPARQRNRRNPDGIAPGQCRDLSNPPASLRPGGGANCALSMADAKATCPGYDGTGPYPNKCPNFDQLGFRVPFMAISPFSKPSYVSHTLGDHTSLVALVEKRFMRTAAGKRQPSIEARDAYADTLEDLFDFDHSPSLDTPIPSAPPESPTDLGCH